MPRISQKAQLTQQLQDIWLCHHLIETFFDNNDVETLQVILSQLHHTRLSSFSLPFQNLGSDHPISNTELSDLLNPHKDFAIKVLEQEAEEGGIEKELEILAIMISGIRYLGPRAPIPRSQYLFTHHVSL